jgi:argininosuccinate lyase
VVADTNDLAALTTAAEAVAARRRIDGVVTTCDYYLVAAAQVARRLGRPAAPVGALRTATRKDLVRHALTAAGLPNPRYAVAEGWDDAGPAAAGLGYPLVAKPVDLNAGAGVRLVTDEAALKDAVGEIQDVPTNSRGQAVQRLVLLEEVLAGVEVSVETVTRAGRTTVLAVTDKTVTGAPAFVESGHMVPARLEPAQIAAAGAFAAAVIDAVGLTHGLGHVEVMLTPDGPRLVELNPRQGGGYIFDLVDLVTGSHPLDLLVALALGEATAPGSSKVASAAIVFVLSPEPATIVAVEGADRLDADPGVIGWALPTPAVARAPVDNDAYLGHVMAVGDADRDARRRAEAAIAAIRLVTSDGRRLRPLGIPTAATSGER